MDRLVESCRVDIESNEEQIRQLEKYRAEYKSVNDLLETMPETLNPRVLVPMGSKCGFFYGYLKHTNEIMAHLGDNYFKKMTACQARQVVSKRIKEIDEQIEFFRGHKKNLDEKLDIAQELSTKGGDSQEIKEPYVEDTEKEWMEKHRGNVAREREAARKEREKAKSSGSIEEDPLKKLLEMKDGDEESEEEPAPPPMETLKRTGSFEKRVKWDFEEACSVPKSDKKSEKTEQTASRDNRIVFRHSPSSTSKVLQPSPASSEAGIQAPSDIYAIFSTKTVEVPQPKSILKKTPEIKQVFSSEKEKQTPVIPVPPSEPVFPPPSTAVQEKVIERTPLSESAQSNVTNSGARMTSRFRKERVIQG